MPLGAFRPLRSRRKGPTAPRTTPRQLSHCWLNNADGTAVAYPRRPLSCRTTHAGVGVPSTPPLPPLPRPLPLSFALHQSTRTPTIIYPRSYLPTTTTDLAQAASQTHLTRVNTFPPIPSSRPYHLPLVPLPSPRPGLLTPFKTRTRMVSGPLMPPAPHSLRGRGTGECVGWLARRPERPFYLDALRNHDHSAAFNPLRNAE